MVLPVTYLPRETLARSAYAVGDFSRVIERSRQKAPYNVPAKYYRRQSRTERIVAVGIASSYTALAPPASTGTWGIGNSFDTRDMDLTDWANNSAYDEFKELVQNEAMLYVNWHEREQAIQSAVRRLSQLYLFTRAIRTRSPRQAALALGVDPRRVPPGVWKRTKIGAKGLGSTWLEWHFGWDPLMKDISATVDILNRPHFDQRIEGKGKTQYRSEIISYGTTFKYFSERVTKVRAKAVADVRVSNPNVAMAVQLGLINPLAIAWELVPYSFLIDWFSNVGAYLQSYTDFGGLTITNASTTLVGRVTYHFQETSKTYAYSFDGYQTGEWVRRTLALPSVKLGFRPRKRLSVVRGATAIALLLNHMKR